MSWARPWIIGLLALLLFATWWQSRPEAGEIRRTRLLMGTAVEIVAIGPDREKLEEAVQAAFNEMARFEAIVSRHIPDSETARLSASISSLEVSPETADLIALGLDVAHQSRGAFDLTLGRLKALWGMDGETPRIPGAKEIQTALHGIGPHSLSLNGNRVFKRHPALQVDLGGIAKGYIVDRAIDVLRSTGVEHAAVNAGGDMYLLGDRNGRPWRIGIQHPRTPGGVLTSVAVSDRAVVTSGDYERFFEKDGRRYHHLFDPQTGYPSMQSMSVSVVADSVALGDALSTAIFILGPRGLSLLDHYPGTEALVVAADGSTFSSPGWPGTDP